MHGSYISEMKGLVIVVCLTSFISLISSQCHQETVDGCSIPYNLPYFYKKSFTPSCDRHDVCYTCGSSKGISKTTCDVKFYHEIKAVCATHTVGKRFVSAEKRDLITQFCNLVSVSYYEAVKHFGASHFVTSSPSWCSHSWVNGCLP